MTQIEGHILNLWSVCAEGTRALGPGDRYVIWTQGCMKRCPGCTSPESQAIEPKMIVDVEQLASDIIAKRNMSGITISGGEPFLQAASLARLLYLVKQQRPEMNVIVFTGYLKEELNWNDAQQLLAATDVLIDGPFCMDKATDKGLRGSTNQRIHFLTDILTAYRDELENASRKQEVYVDSDKIVSIGIPNNNNIKPLNNNNYE